MANTRPNKNIPTQEENPLFHDTWKLLKNYRDAVWNLELAVQQVRNTFEIEYGSSIEEFLDSMYIAGADVGGTKLENYAKSIERSNKMLTLLNSAVDILRNKHKHGEQYYWILYYSYLSPQQLQNTDEIIENLRPHIANGIIQAASRSPSDPVNGQESESADGAEGKGLVLYCLQGCISKAFINLLYLFEGNIKRRQMCRKVTDCPAFLIGVHDGIQLFLRDPPDLQKAVRILLHDVKSPCPETVHDQLRSPRPDPFYHPGRQIGLYPFLCLGPDLLPAVCLELESVFPLSRWC